MLTCRVLFEWVCRGRILDLGRLLVFGLLFALCLVRRLLLPLLRWLLLDPLTLR